MSRFRNLGEFLISARNSALNLGTDPRLLEQRGAPSGAGEQIPSDGGFLVAPEHSQKIWQRLYLTGSLMSRATEARLTKLKMSIPAIDETSRADSSRWGGVLSHYVAEGNSLTPITASKAKFRTVKLTAKKLVVLLAVTEELDADAMDQFATTIAIQELKFRIEQSMVNGNLGGPQGIMNSNALITVAKDVAQPAATVSTSNILSMFSRMWPASRVSGGGAVWLVNGELESELMKLTLPVGSGGSAVPIYTPNEDPDSSSPYATMLGSPVLPCEYCAQTGQPGDIIYASWADYVLAVKTFQDAVSMHVLFNTAEMVYRLTVRLDGVSLWSAPLLPANGSGISKSPFIALAART